MLFENDVGWIDLISRGTISSWRGKGMMNGAPSKNKYRQANDSEFIASDFIVWAGDHSENKHRQRPLMRVGARISSFGLRGIYLFRQGASMSVS